MLKVDILKANEKLKALPDDVLAEIESMSKSDEKTQIDAALKTHKDRIDKDIEGITGVPKPNDTPTHVYLKSSLTSLSEKAKEAANAEKYKADFEKSTKEIESLKKQIAEGGDGATKKLVASLEQKLEDERNTLAALKKQKEDAEKDLADKLAKSEADRTKADIVNSINQHVKSAGLKYNEAVPANIMEEMVQTRQQKFIASLKAERDENGNLVFRGEDGKILKDSSLQPVKAGDLYAKQNADLFAKHTQSGGGTESRGGGGGGGSLDLSGAKSQIQADEMIKQYVHKNEGLTTSSDGYSERLIELRTQNKVADLPMREQ